MYTYFAYNLHIRSNIPFPELVPSRREDVAAEPDVNICIRSIAPAETRFANTYQKFQGYIAPFNIERFMVLDGNQIILDPPPDMTEELLRPIILGPVLTLLLRQRGLLVLHASGINTPEGAIAFLGNSGWGKSTLANAFYQQGYSLLTDDVMAIELKDGSPPVAFPAYPHVKLMADAADALGYDYSKLTPLAAKALKRHNCIDRSFSQEPVTVRKIYALEKVARNRNTIKPLSPQAAIIELIGHTRGTNVLTLPEHVTTHLRQCTDLVKSVPISRLERSHDLDGLSEIIQIIESDIQQNAGQSRKEDKPLLFAS
ncbi:MAG: hypothetical protein WA949_06460 [Phormidesmis sp.]